MNKNRSLKKNPGVDRLDIHEPLLGGPEVPLTNYQSSQSFAQPDGGLSIINQSELSYANTHMNYVPETAAINDASILLEQPTVVSEYIEQYDMNSHQPLGNNQNLSSTTGVHSVNQSFGNISLDVQNQQVLGDPPSQFQMNNVPEQLKAQPELAQIGGKYNTIRFQQPHHNQAADASEYSPDQNTTVILPNIIRSSGLTVYAKYHDDKKRKKSKQRQSDSSDESEEEKHNHLFPKITPQNTKKRNRQEFVQAQENPFHFNYQKGKQPGASRGDQKRSNNIVETAGTQARTFPMNSEYIDERIKVTRSQLGTVMKSKLDVFNILSKEGQYYLPPFAECTMDFIKDIMTGKKRAFRNSEIMIIDVPFFDELSANKIFELIKSNPRFTDYLPELQGMKRPLNRKYLFNVVNTVDPRFFPKNIQWGYQQRKERQGDKMNQGILMDPHMHQIFFNSNQILHNRGRALTYFSNVDKKRKRPVDFDVEDDNEEMPQARARHEYKRKIDPQAQNPLLLQMQQQRNGGASPFTNFSTTGQNSLSSPIQQFPGGPKRKPNAEQEVIMLSMTEQNNHSQSIE